MQNYPQKMHETLNWNILAILPRAELHAQQTAQTLVQLIAAR